MWRELVLGWYGGVIDVFIYCVSLGMRFLVRGWFVYLEEDIGIGVIKEVCIYG